MKPELYLSGSHSYYRPTSSVGDYATHHSPLMSAVVSLLPASTNTRRSLVELSEDHWEGEERGKVKVRPGYADWGEEPSQLDHVVLVSHSGLLDGDRDQPLTHSDVHLVVCICSRSSDRLHSQSPFPRGETRVLYS